MTVRLTPEGYEQTKQKLQAMEERLAQLDQQTGISDVHRSESRLSFEEMIGQYRREIKLYEASQSENAISS